jgi:hypothetical protein
MNSGYRFSGCGFSGCGFSGWGFSGCRVDNLEYNPPPPANFVVMEEFDIKMEGLG